MYKSRMEVETAFDAFKNTLEADRSYMKNDQAMEGWMFMNYLALLAYPKTSRKTRVAVKIVD